MFIGLFPIPEFSSSQHGDIIIFLKNILCPLFKRFRGFDRYVEYILRKCVFPSLRASREFKHISVIGKPLK